MKTKYKVLEVLRRSQMIGKLLDLVLLGLIVFHCYVSPFTKVEESFNIQAIHDLLFYGPFTLSKFDHQSFPGVVKRTFVGAGFISFIVLPLTQLVSVSNLIIYQYISRIALGLLNGLLIIRIRRILESISKNKKLGLYYALLQYSQFHIVYYSSRTLPNFILLPLVNYALGSILKGNLSKGLALLAFTAVIFRAEIGVFALSIAFVAIFSYQISFDMVTVALVIGVVAGLLTTLSVDSYFWNEFPCIPEISSILFNVYEGNSKLWGVEPFDAYFRKYFFTIFCPPTVLLFTLPGLAYKTINTRVNSIRTIGLGSLLFVLLLSFQPHKEWRFIVYAVPGLTILASNGSAGFKKGMVSSIVKLTIISSALVSLVLSLAMLYISSLNYPGGVAISHLNDKIMELDNIVLHETINRQNITIHVDVPACMTGVTLFTQIRDKSLNHFDIFYDKLEDDVLLNDEALWKGFDYVITDIDMDRTRYDNLGIDYNTKLFKSQHFKWNKTETIKGFSNINISPLIAIIRNYNIAIKILKNSASNDFTMLFDLVNNVVVQKDKLFIYAREDI